MLAMLSEPLTAQMTGSRLGRNATIHDAQGVFENMVRCVGERSPKYAHQVMQLVPGSEAEHKKIFGNEGDLGMCMDDQRRRLVLPDGVELTMNARMFRTRLANVMAKQELKGVDPARLAQAPAWSMATYGEAANGDAMQLALFAVGDCVIAAKPVEAAAFVQHGAKSSKGAAALKGLASMLGSCVTQGTTLQMTPEMLSVALSEPVYHRARGLAADRTTGGSG